MSDLHEVRIGDHISFLSGYPFSSEYFDQQEGIRLIRIRDLLQSEAKTYYRGPFDSRWLVKPQDVLIGMDGDFNAVRWRGDVALLNQRILKAEPRSDGAIDLGFFYYWCGPFLDQIHNQTAATTVKHLSIRDIEKARGLFPERPVQRRIGEILSTLDEAIEQTEALIAKYQQIKAGLMRDLFARGLAPDGSLRPASESQHTTFGWIPRTWHVGSLLDVSDRSRQPILTGPFGADLGNDDFIAAGVPVLRIGNIQQGYLDLSDLLFVTPQKARDRDRYRVCEGDLLFARQGATTGRNALASKAVKHYLINYHIIRVALDQSRCSPVFIEAAFQGEIVKTQIAREKGRGTREGINTAQLKALEFPLAPLQEQRLIASVLRSQVSLIDEANRNVEKLRMLKNGLMRDLLTGCVRVDIEESTA